MANKGRTGDERKLRAFLQTIIQTKNTQVPREILDELERVNKSGGFVWEKERWTPIEDNGEQKVLGEYKPHLVRWSIQQTGFDLYLSELIPKLQDPDWVAALRECPRCRKILMSNTKWRNKFCSEQCKTKYWGSENRKRIKCPGIKNFTKTKEEILLGECKQIQKEEPYPECEECPNRTQEYMAPRKISLPRFRPKVLDEIFPGDPERYKYEGERKSAIHKYYGRKKGKEEKEPNKKKKGEK